MRASPYPSLRAASLAKPSPKSSGAAAGVSLATNLVGVQVFVHSTCSQCVCFTQLGERGFTMIRTSAAAAVLTAGLLAGCAYNADTAIAPANNVVTSFSQKLGGRWLLRTDSSAMVATLRPSDFNCSAHTFPIDFSSGFPGSLRGTLANVVDHIEDAPETANADRAKALGARGIIMVRGDQVRGNLRVVPGFWTANIVSEVEVSAAVTVDGPSGRLFGKTIDGRGRGDTGAGAFCSGGAESVKQAADAAQRDLLRRIGEEIGNSERLRSTR
jgi:hypothetical protein